MAEESKVSIPARLAFHHSNQVTGEAVVVDADLLELGDASAKELSLSLLAPVGFVNHQFETMIVGFADNLENLAAKVWLQEPGVVDSFRRAEEGMIGNGVVKKISHIPYGSISGKSQPVDFKLECGQRLWGVDGT